MGQQGSAHQLLGLPLTRLTARQLRANHGFMPSETIFHGDQDRLLTISSRFADEYYPTESGAKHLQNIFTAWFPRMVYADLTNDTVRVNVIVRIGIISRKHVFDVSFLNADGAAIKQVTYDEDLMIGKRCDAYIQGRTKYEGKKDGADVRRVYYRRV